jgi:hypothetical protein
MARVGTSEGISDQYKPAIHVSKVCLTFLSQGAVKKF